MNPSNRNLFLILMLASVSVGVDLPTERTTERNDPRYRRHVSKQSFSTPPYWDHILREFMFRTISPPPPGNHHLYKRLLDAPFYGGPFPIVSNDTASVVLSRGDVYYLPDGHWVFCQQGCTDCEVCIERTHPAAKWVLRRIKRISAHGTTRHDLQLTIVPQIDGSYHMKSLWPRSYVYVTSQGEQDAYTNDKHSYRNDGGAYLNSDDDPPEEKGNSENSWTTVDRNPATERRVAGNSSDDGVSPRTPEKNVTEKYFEKVSSTSTPSRKNDTQQRVNDSRYEKNPHPSIQVTEKGDTNGTSAHDRTRGNARMRSPIPKLILGTDQSGQRHLVHVVPADANANLMNSVASIASISDSSNRTAYQRILRRIFDSLNSNKMSIENFLQPLKQNDGKTNEESEEHLQQETRSGIAGFRQAGRLYPNYTWRNQNESLRPHVLNWIRQRKGLHGNRFTDTFLNNTIEAVRNLNNSRLLVSSNTNGLSNLKSKLIEHDRHRNTTPVQNLKDNVTFEKQDDTASAEKHKTVIDTPSSTKSGEDARNHTPPISGNKSIR